MELVGTEDGIELGFVGNAVGIELLGTEVG